MAFLNPFRRVVPPGWAEEYPVNAFEFLHYEARDLGGYRRLLRMLLPAFYRDDDECWRILGPRWSTRTCGESTEWCLFMVQHDKQLGWDFKGLTR